MVIGIQETKANLSIYRRLVKYGDEVILTEWERPVFKIVPISGEDLSLSNRLKKVEEKGVSESENKKEHIIPLPISIVHSPAQQMLREDRSG